ncbi:hypothetical protein B296_00040537 [Ensete ventricosum]|uniref:Uncharacterized protein n=1 Tax=Ensete ventricosum TaxID=4639 RepID=A0A426YWN9_ENSVE|nr:hypothetical protein B296_00040537 [Ensete ventricosum]
MRRCCAPQVAASARDRALLPLGDSPYGLATSPCAATWSAGPPAGAVPTGGHRCEWVPHYRLLLLWAPCCKWLPLWVAALAGGLGHIRLSPCRWPATLFPRCLHYENATRTCRIILCNAILSYVV